MVFAGLLFAFAENILTAGATYWYLLLGDWEMFLSILGRASLAFGTNFDAHQF